MQPKLFALACIGLLCAPLIAEPPAALPRIAISKDGSHFVTEPGGERFTIWGVNYDHDESYRLIEDYWDHEWAKVEEDFAEIKSLGANVVRIHLQFGKFMIDARTPDDRQLQRLRQLLQLAEKLRIYLDLTGLGCYHKHDVPPWYDAMNESDRWAAQAAFWEAVAATCSGSPAVFCYNLMNEPVIPGQRKDDGQWLAGEPLGGKYFVQYLTLDPAGRDRTQIATQWLERMIGAIRRHDRRALVTVGLFVWSGFDPKTACQPLDFISLHIYPQAGKLDAAVDTVRRYDAGKPLVIEEMFPLACSADELVQFVEATRPIAEGWISFYWGDPVEKVDRDASDDHAIGRAILQQWLVRFRRLAQRVDQQP